MKIGGLEKTSLIDYPEKISCVIFTIGCNFACPYCHNPALANGTASEINENELACALVGRNGFIDAVVISGGEPTLQKDLPAFCEKIKKLDYLVKLDTNGSNPDVLNLLIKNKLVDYIAMDIKTIPQNYSPHIWSGKSTKIYQSIHLIMNAAIPYEFKTTCVSPFVNRKIIKRIAEIISGCDRYFLQKFHYSDRILNPEFFKSVYAHFSSNELEDFKVKANEFVKNCEIR